MNKALKRIIIKDVYELCGDEVADEVTKRVVNMGIDIDSVVCIQEFTNNLYPYVVIWYKK